MDFRGVKRAAGSNSNVKKTKQKVTGNQLKLESFPDPQCLLRDH